MALTLWDQLGDGTPQHHQKSVELFYQLHNLVPSSSICEDVISQQLTHKDKVSPSHPAHACTHACVTHALRYIHIHIQAHNAKDKGTSLGNLLHLASEGVCRT